MKSIPFLPEGSEIIATDEKVIWRGRPLVAGFANRLFHLRAVMGYFVLLAVWNIALDYRDGFRAAMALTNIEWIAIAALGVAALIVAAAWLLAITTCYTITDRRVILQIGVALPIVLTLPLKRIASADLRLYPDGSGDIPLTLTKDDKLAYLLIWPHARPWCVKIPKPMLRSTPDARNVAALLAQALLVASPGGEVRASEPANAAAPGYGERWAQAEC